MMAQNNDASPMGASHLVDMIMGYQRSQIVFTACSLGVFEELHSSSVPMTALALARRVHTDPDATERLLNALVALQLLDKEEDGHGAAVYLNSASTAKFLLKSSPMSLRPLANSVAYMYPMWANLRPIVKTGHREQVSTSQDDTEGDPPPSFLLQPAGPQFCSTDAMQLDFIQAMHMFSKMDAAVVAKAFDLTEFDSACDLGGGSGTLGLQLATSYPEMHVTVMDLDHVITMAQHFTAAPKPHNLTFQSGDFFSGPLPPADLYILSHVIHDWSQDRVEQLLHKVYQTLHPGGAVLILEKVLSESKDSPVMTAMFDMGMLVASEGRERSASEYHTLLTHQGFRDVTIKVLPQSKFRDAILARKYTDI